MRKLALAMLVALAVTAGAQADAISFSASGGTSGTGPGGESTWIDVTSEGTYGGLTFDIGGEATAGSKVLDLNVDGLFHDLGSKINYDLYSGTALQSGVFNNNGSKDEAIGVKISGIAPGTYTIYVTGRNTNIDPTESTNNEPDEYDVYYGVNTLDFTSATPLHMTNANLSKYDTDPSDDNTWVEGDTYVKFDVTLEAGDYLAIMSDATTVSQARGFINTIEIVPEPATMALLSIGGLGVLIRRRK